MPLTIRAIALVATLAVSLPGQAQLLGLGFESNIELTKQDLGIIRRTVDEQVHGKPVGTTASWTNPASQNYGTIQLVKTFTSNGRPCETVAYTVATRRMAVSPEHYSLNSCRLANGQWRIT